MKIALSLLVTSILFWFVGNPPTTNEFKSILNRPKIAVSYFKQIQGSYKIEIPVNLRWELQEVVDQYASDDTNLETCDSAEVNVSYQVEFYNGDILSLRKTTSIFNCYATAVDYQEYINLLVFNDTIFTVEIDYNRLDNNLSSPREMPSDCSSDEKKVSLFFCDGNVFINEFIDEICQVDTEIRLNVDNMIFRAF
ncbi:hypothetical protein AAU57_14155 [Nonlabens sp. YIK11]|uniref:hypothetical protein n=1 Tax=Nonlabens sp. YIK11 TaxID=1453349 RepID=UPI0006DCABCF|nr:hypothetical protein [Nonlabens sp. YIK11]KQC34353.1 hypothetical protein AAU57_14155 [Nonlabens sp. YIK11]